MAGTLNCRYIFGSKANVKDGLGFAEEKAIVYAAGHNIVKNYFENNQQEFIPGSDASQGISAISISPSRRLVAVAEKGDQGVVYVYNLRTLYKRKTLTTSDIESHEFISLSFSADDSLLLTQGGGPDWTLCVWLWEKGKMLANISLAAGPSTSIYGCGINPVNPTKCAVHGKGLFKFLSIEEDRFHNIPNSAAFAERKVQDYSSHAWLPEDMSVLGTGDGDLLLFQKEILLTQLTCSPSDGNAISALVSCSRGFLSGDEQGVVRLFEPTPEEGVYFKETAVFRLADADIMGPLNICSMALSVSENVLMVQTGGNQIASLSFSSGTEGETSSFRVVGSGSHGPETRKTVTVHGPVDISSITGLDLCLRKPIVATCAVDRTVRIWNYEEKRLEISAKFGDVPYSVALHPSGLHLLVGFEDKLRYMNLHMDELKVVKEFAVKQCREVRFSNGGQMFAAAYHSNILVFNSYTGEQCAILKGHNGRVQQLVWLADDTRLMSTGADGAVYQWDLEESKRVREFVQKGINYTSAALPRAGHPVYVVGSDSKLKEIDMIKGVEVNTKSQDITLGQLAMSSTGQMLFAGTSSGSHIGIVKSFAVPVGQAIPYEYPALASPITRMQLSADDNYLFVAGNDGVLVMFEVRDKDGRAPRSDITGPWSSHVLVTRGDLEERKSAIKELRDKVASLQSNNQHVLRVAKMSFQEDLRKLREKYNTMLEQERQQFELLKEEKIDLEREFSERLSAMEVAHRAEVQKRESQYQAKIMEEVERFQQLQMETELQKDRWNEQQSTMVNRHHNYVTALREEYEAKLETAREARIEVEDEIEGMKKDWEETCRQMEEDIDTEIEQMKSRYEGKLNAEREASLKYKGDNGIMRKKFLALNKDIEEQREEKRMMKEKQEELKGRIEDLNSQIDELRQRISDRDSTIGEKEKKIYELKKRNQELEKFKFVLDYKIKELKRQIEPRENEIAAMKAQIKEVDKELEDYHKTNAELDQLIGKLRKQLDETQVLINKHRVSLQSQQAKIDDFHAKLQETAQHIQNPDSLETEFTGLYKEHAEGTDQDPGVEKDIASEYVRQQAHLEKTVKFLKVKATKEKEKKRNETVRLMQSNMDLIDQINQLKADIRAVQLEKTKNEANSTFATVAKTSGRKSARSARSAKSGLDPTELYDLLSTRESQRNEIGDLKMEIARLEEALLNHRPLSKTKPVVQ